MDRDDDRAETIEVGSLAPGLLVAAPSMRDPLFGRSIILLIEHDDEGSFGLIVNREAPIDLDAVLDGAGVTAQVPMRGRPVYWGGPVQPEAGAVLYRADRPMSRYDPSSTIRAPLRISFSMSILQDVAAGDGPERFELFLGRAGWGPGQLERELAEGSWLPLDLDERLIFDETSGLGGRERWEHALGRLGARPADIVGGAPAEA